MLIVKLVLTEFQKYEEELKGCKIHYRYLDTALPQQSTQTMWYIL